MAAVTVHPLLVRRQLSERAAEFGRVEERIVANPPLLLLMRIIRELQPEGLDASAATQPYPNKSRGTAVGGTSEALPVEQIVCRIIGDWAVTREWFPGATSPRPRRNHPRRQAATFGARLRASL
jgi:hypothetical protein